MNRPIGVTVGEARRVVWMEPACISRAFDGTILHLGQALETGEWWLWWVKRGIVNGMRTDQPRVAWEMFHELQSDSTKHPTATT